MGDETANLATDLVEGNHEKTRIFVSYSRADGVFVAKLVQALKARDFDVFQDIEDILPSEAWQTRIANMIGQSDTIVFVISPDSVGSKVCQWELETAAKLSKRLVPVLYRELPISEVPEQVAQINFIFFNEPAQFDAAFGRLTAALDTDIDWLREHTAIGELARRWDKQGRRSSMLLRGKNIKEAEGWLVRRPKLAPEADELQRRFIRKSRTAQRQRKRVAVAGVLVALLAMTGVPVTFYPNQTYVTLVALSELRRVALGSPDRIPVVANAKAQLNATIKVLADMLAADATQKLASRDPTFNSWAAAQTMVAVKGLRNIGLPSVDGYFGELMNARCGCWQELAEKQPHTGASGWVLFAIGNYGGAAPDAALRYFLSLQSDEGWWPLHPSTSAPYNASTYATGWALLGLTSQRDKIVDRELKAQVEAAIGKGMAWLQRTRVGGKASWKDYPDGGEGRETIGVSGLAMHVLHQMRGTAAVSQIDKEWLSRLPVDELDADTADQSNMTITLRSGAPEFDRTRNYRLPWALIASADAYASGSALQRARVAAWVELVLRRDLATQSVLRQNWVAAELLYALRYLEQRLQ